MRMFLPGTQNVSFTPELIILDWIAEQEIELRDLLGLWKIHFLKLQVGFGVIFFLSHCLSKHVLFKKK